MTAGPGDGSTGITRVRWGSLLLGGGAGGFVSATILRQLHQWQRLTESDDAGRTADPAAVAVTGNVVRLGLWIAAVIGIGLLWAASERGARRLSGGAIGGWALIGWAGATALVGVLHGVLDAGERAWIGAPMIILAAALAGLGWRAQRGRSLRPGPREPGPPSTRSAGRDLERRNR